MMWSSSYALWRMLSFLAKVHDCANSLILRIGVGKFITLGVLAGGLLLWLSAPPSSPFLILCLFGALQMARDAIRHPEGFRLFGIFERDESEARQSIRFIMVGGAPFLGYIAVGLVSAYWFASGEVG